MISALCWIWGKLRLKQSTLVSARNFRRTRFGVVICLIRKRGGTRNLMICLGAVLISRPEIHEETSELRRIASILPFMFFQKNRTFNIIRKNTYRQFLCEKYVLFRNVSGFSWPERYCYCLEIKRKRTEKQENMSKISDMITSIRETHSDDVSNGVLWFVHCEKVPRLRLTVDYVLHNPLRGKKKQNPEQMFSRHWSVRKQYKTSPY